MTYDLGRKSRPVVVGSYQETWRDDFCRLAKILRVTLGSAALRIDHIGSTSVPHLAAKDVIDIQITVMQLPNEPMLEVLRAQGFRPRGQLEYDNFIGIDDTESKELTKYYAREPEGERRTHIHIRKQGHLNQRYALLFRDYLRASLTPRRAYETIKIRLAQIFPESIDGYLYIKDPLMDLIFEAATQWAMAVDWQPDEEYF